MKLKDTQLTIVHPFYNDGHNRVPIQIEAWMGYPDWVWDNIKVVLIDDHSTPSLLSHFPVDNKFNFDLKIYRIKDDLTYNLPGAWNLGFHVSDTEWVFGMNSDERMLKENMLKLLTQAELDPEYYYQFKRNRITYMENLRAHGAFASGSWLVRKSIWKQIDGFDEDFGGYVKNSWGYWEHDFNLRLKRVTERRIARSETKENLWIRIDEHMPDCFGLEVWEIHPNCS